MIEIYQHGINIKVTRMGYLDTPGYVTIWNLDERLKTFWLWTFGNTEYNQRLLSIISFHIRTHLKFGVISTGLAYKMFENQIKLELNIPNWFTISEWIKNDTTA